MHGLAGFFDSKLYADVHISINPETETEGMFSWFPLFIPFTNPTRVKAGDVITVNIWR